MEHPALTARRKSGWHGKGTELESIELSKESKDQRKLHTRYQATEHCFPEYGPRNPEVPRTFRGPQGLNLFPNKGVIFTLVLTFAGMVGCAVG